MAMFMFKYLYWYNKIIFKINDLSFYFMKQGMT